MAPFEWLVGLWESVDGLATFPTIKTLQYKDIIEFRPSSGDISPVLEYRTWSTSTDANGIIKADMHHENGFLRAFNNGKVALSVAHSYGTREF
jgi:nitrobindin-like protein